MGRWLHCAQEGNIVIEKVPIIFVVPPKHRVKDSIPNHINWFHSSMHTCVRLSVYFEIMSDLLLLICFFHSTMPATGVSCHCFLHSCKKPWCPITTKNPTQPFPDLSSKKLCVCVCQICFCKFLENCTFWLWGSCLLAILSSMLSSSGTLKVASQTSQRGNSECLQPQQWCFCLHFWCLTYFSFEITNMNKRKRQKQPNCGISVQGLGFYSTSTSCRQNHDENPWNTTYM